MEAECQTLQIMLFVQLFSKRLRFSTSSNWLIMGCTTSELFRLQCLTILPICFKFLMCLHSLSLPANIVSEVAFTSLQLCVCVSIFEFHLLLLKENIIFKELVLQYNILILDFVSVMFPGISSKGVRCENWRYALELQQRDRQSTCWRD